MEKHLLPGKTCPKCGIYKDRDDFYRDNIRKDGMQFRCKECNHAHQREWERRNPEKTAAQRRRYATKNAEKLRARARARYYANPDRMRNNNLRKNFGITLEQYDAMVEAQNGVCAICGRGPRGRSKLRLGVDHDHKTGKVRDLLCGWCNAALGYFEDDTAVMRKAIAYIRRHRASS